MKLIASKNKAKITWVRIYEELSGGQIAIGYDAKCSCGWQTKSGGGLKSGITQRVWQHKYFDHNYSIEGNK